MEHINQDLSSLKPDIEFVVKTFKSGGQDLELACQQYRATAKIDDITWRDILDESLKVLALDSTPSTEHFDLLIKLGANQYRTNVIEHLTKKQTWDVLKYMFEHGQKYSDESEAESIYHIERAIAYVARYGIDCLNSANTEDINNFLTGAQIFLNLTDIDYIAKYEELQELVAEVEMLKSTE